MKPITRLRLILAAYQAATLDASIAFYASIGHPSHADRLVRLGDLSDACMRIQRAVSQWRGTGTGDVPTRLRADAAGAQGRHAIWTALVAEDVIYLFSDPTRALRGHAFPASPPSDPTPEHDAIEIHAEPESEIEPALRKALDSGRGELPPDDCAGDVREAMASSPEHLDS